MAQWGWSSYDMCKKSLVWIDFPLKTTWKFSFLTTFRTFNPCSQRYAIAWMKPVVGCIWRPSHVQGLTFSTSFCRTGTLNKFEQEDTRSSTSSMGSHFLAIAVPCQLLRHFETFPWTKTATQNFDPGLDYPRLETAKLPRPKQKLIQTNLL